MIRPASEPVSTRDLVPEMNSDGTSPVPKTSLCACSTVSNTSSLVDTRKREDRQEPHGRQTSLARKPSICIGFRYASAFLRLFLRHLWSFFPSPPRRGGG